MQHRTQSAAHCRTRRFGRSATRLATAPCRALCRPTCRPNKRTPDYLNFLSRNQFVAARLAGRAAHCLRRRAPAQCESDFTFAPLSLVQPLHQLHQCGPARDTLGLRESVSRRSHSRPARLVTVPTASCQPQTLRRAVHQAAHWRSLGALRLLVRAPIWPNVAPSVKSWQSVLAALLWPPDARLTD